MDEALEELMHPSISGTPLQPDVQTCDVYDTLMILKITGGRRASIRVTATDTGDPNAAPVKGTGAIGPPSESGNNQAVVVSPLTEGGHRYNLAIQELDAQDNPVGNATQFNYICPATKTRILPPNPQLQSVSPSPSKVSFSVTGLGEGDHLYYKIVKVNPGPIQPTYTKVDEDLKELTGDPTKGSDGFSVAPDSKAQYSLIITAQRSTAPPPSQAGAFVASYRSDLTHKEFNGLDPLITDSFQLTIQKDSLLVAAKTNNVPAKLAATFTPQSDPTGTATAASKATVEAALNSDTTKMEVDPSFPISLAALGQPALTNLPTLYLKLTDNNGRTQEARVTLAVSTKVPASTPNASKAQSDVDQTVAAAQQGKSQKDNWGSILQTGLGAVVKAFVLAL
jgi:hypothetical protein